MDWSDIMDPADEELACSQPPEPEPEEEAEEVLLPSQFRLAPVLLSPLTPEVLPDSMTDGAGAAPVLPEAAGAAAEGQAALAQAGGEGGQAAASEGSALHTGVVAEAGVGPVTPPRGGAGWWVRSRRRVVGKQPPPAGYSRSPLSTTPLANDRQFWRGRSYWVKQWLATRPKMFWPRASTFEDKRKAARAAWVCLSPLEKAAACREALRPEAGIALVCVCVQGAARERRAPKLHDNVAGEVLHKGIYVAGSSAGAQSPDAARHGCASSAPSIR